MIFNRDHLIKHILAAVLSIALLFTSTVPAQELEEPGRPSITRAIPSQRSVLVFFSPPTTGGGPIDHFIVEVTSSDPAIPVRESIQTSGGIVSLSGLEEAVDYVVSVTAFNDKGRGESDKRTFTTKAAAPNGPPTGVSASATKTTVSLSWQPPLPIFINSKEGISQYVIYVKPSSERDFPLESTTVSMATNTVTGLNPGLEYDFLILAANNIGVSSDNRGATFTATTDEDVPSPPLNVTVVTQFTRALVYWRPPQPSNGQLTEYQIKYYDTRSPSDVKTITESSASLSTLISGLEEGAELVLQMRASTSVGWGPYSPAQQLQVVRQAVLEDTCALNSSTVRMVFVYSPLLPPSVSHLGVRVFVSQTSAFNSEHSVYSAQHPQNYVDVPTSSLSGPLFWRFSVQQLYRGLEVFGELSASSELQLQSLKVCTSTPPSSSMTTPNPSVTTPTPSVTTPTPSVTTPTPSVTPTPTPSVTTPPDQTTYCYNRTLTSEDCKENDIVLVVRSLRRRKDSACSYRVKIVEIRKGRTLLRAHRNVKTQNINIDFPIHPCSSSCPGRYSNGCVQMEARGVYVVGGALRVDGSSTASLLPYLPRGFLVDRAPRTGSGEVC